MDKKYRVHREFDCPAVKLLDEINPSGMADFLFPQLKHLFKFRLNKTATKVKHHVDALNSPFPYNGIS
jgi:hypothetical protein